MKRLLIALLALALALGILSGCNDSNTTSAAVSRVLAGFVYVRGNSGSGSPDVIISPNSNAPSGYFKPTAGTVTVAVTDGTITRAPDSEVFNMALGNEILCMVTQNSTPFNCTVSGSGFQLNGTPKTAFSTQTVSLGTTSSNGSVLGLNVGAGSYTAGPPAQMRMTIRNRGGNPGNSGNSFVAPLPATGGNWISGNSYDVAIGVYDAEGTVVSGATTALSSDDPVRLAVAGTLLTTVSGGGQPAANVELTASITSPVSTLTESFTANFNYGTTTTVTTVSDQPTLMWEVAGGVINSSNLTVTVRNQFGAPIPGATVDMTNTDKLIAPEGSSGPNSPDSHLFACGVPCASGCPSSVYCSLQAGPWPPIRPRRYSK
jgi:hypothetical protein